MELSWTGKEIAKNLAKTPSKCKLELIKPSSSENVVIAGDNLDALKLLDTKNNNNIQIETKPILEVKTQDNQIKEITKINDSTLSEEMKDKIIEVYTNPETVQPKSISQEEMLTEIANIDNYIKSMFK